MSKYLIIIEDKKSDFSAYSPDVPGCVATGNSIQSTVKKMIVALEAHFESLDELPEPKGLNYYRNTDFFKIGSTDFILLAELDDDWQAE